MKHRIPRLQFIIALALALVFGTASAQAQTPDPCAAIQAELTATQAKLANAEKDKSFGGKQIGALKAEVGRLQTELSLEMAKKGPSAAPPVSSSGASTTPAPATPGSPAAPAASKPTHVVRLVCDDSVQSSTIRKPTKYGYTCECPTPDDPEDADQFVVVRSLEGGNLVARCVASAEAIRDLSDEISHAPGADDPGGLKERVAALAVGQADLGNKIGKLRGEVEANKAAYDEFVTGQGRKWDEQGKRDKAQDKNHDDKLPRFGVGAQCVGGSDGGATVGCGVLAELTQDGPLAWYASGRLIVQRNIADSATVYRTGGSAGGKIRIIGKKGDRATLGGGDKSAVDLIVAADGQGSGSDNSWRAGGYGALRVRTSDHGRLDVGGRGGVGQREHAGRRPTAASGEAVVNYVLSF